MPLEPGLRLGPYEIVEPLGAGGMGEVYRARDTRLDRTVAIKVLSGHLSANPMLKERFDREARAISSLSHPHICSLYDVGHQDEVDYLVMEYLEGESLADRIKEGPLPPEQVINLGAEIAQALSAAHRAGVVHRDLKPGNIMLTREGVKLLDFGLAKMGVEPQVSDSSLTVPISSRHTGDPLTVEGTILGTYQYMAPEQVEGKEADARTDIFALGAVLYEMATGRAAFSGGSQASLIASIMKDQPAPISSIQEMTPPALDRVVRVCMEKDPEERWQTAQDVALQLSWIAEGGSAAGVPRPVTHRRKSRERMAWIATGILAVALLAVAAHDFSRPKPEAPRTVRFRIPAPAGIMSADVPKLSPDGRIVAFNATDSLGTIRVWIQPLDALTAHPLAGTEDARRPFWSPDSKELAFFAGDQLKRVGVEGGTVRVVCDGVNGADGSWSQEGVILFDGSAGDSIRSVPASGGVPRGASTLDRKVGQMEHAWPHFLPDGKHYLFQAQYENRTDSLFVGELGSTETKLLGPAASLMGYSDPGYVLWVQDGALRAQRLNLEKLELEGEPFPVTTQLSVGTTGLASFSASRSGVLAYRSGDTGMRRAVWVDRKGKKLRTVGPPGYYNQPDVDPSGHRIVLERTDGGAAKPDLWILDDSRDVSTRLTYDLGSDTAPVWSADGKQIVFDSDRSGQDDLYLKNADGSGQTIPVWQDSTVKFVTDWSRDGKTLLVQRRMPGSSWDVWSWSLQDNSGAQPVVATKDLEGQARFSPDGNWIAYVARVDDQLQIYVRSASARGGKWQVSLEEGSEPEWRGDGKELYYLALDRRLMAVDIDTSSGFRAGTPHALFRANVAGNYVTRNRYRVANDGQSFLLLAADSGVVPPITVVLNWAAEIQD